MTKFINIRISLDDSGELSIVGPEIQTPEPITCPTTPCQHTVPIENRPPNQDNMDEPDNMAQETTDTDTDTDNTPTSSHDGNTRPETPTQEPIMPQTVPAIDPSLKFKRGVIPAMRAYTLTHPWTGNRAERTTKLAAFHAALCRVYAANIQLHVLTGPGASSYNPQTRTITLNRRISVLTYLHLFRAATAKPSHNPQSVREWGVTLFAKFYPYRVSVLLERVQDNGRMTLPTRTTGQTS